MAGETIPLTFVAEIGDLRKELARVPGITEGEAKRMAIALEKQVKKAEKASKAASKATSRAYAKAARESSKAWEASLMRQAAAAKKAAAAQAKAAAAMKTGMLAAAAAAATVAAGIYKLVDANSVFVDEQIMLQKTTGLSMETLAGLDIAGKNVGISLGVMETGLRKLVQGFSQAGKGSKGATDKLLDLGLSQEQITKGSRDADLALRLTLDAISQLPTDAERAAASIEIFGGRGAKLAATFRDGSASLDEMAARSRELGLVMTEASMIASSEMDRAMADLNVSMQAATVTLGTELTPLVVGIVDGFVAVVGPVVELGVALYELQWAITIVNVPWLVFEETLEAVSLGGARVSVAIDLLSSALNATTGAINPVMDALSSLIELNRKVEYAFNSLNPLVWLYRGAMWATEPAVDAVEESQDGLNEVLYVTGTALEAAKRQLEDYRISLLDVEDQANATAKARQDRLRGSLEAELDVVEQAIQAEMEAGESFGGVMSDLMTQKEESLAALAGLPAAFAAENAKRQEEAAADAKKLAGAEADAAAKRVATELAAIAAQTSSRTAAVAAAIEGVQALAEAEELSVGQRLMSLALIRDDLRAEIGVRAEAAAQIDAINQAAHEAYLERLGEERTALAGAMEAAAAEAEAAAAEAEATGVTVVEALSLVGAAAQMAYQVISQVSDMFADAHQRTLDSIQEQRAALSESMAAVNAELEEANAAHADDTSQTLAEMEAALADANSEMTEEERAALEERTKNRRRTLEAEQAILKKRDEAMRTAAQEEANKLHELQQKADVASIAMSTARAIMAAFGQLGPAGGMIATPILVTMGILQTAEVMGQEPPTIAHDGGLLSGPPLAPDELLVKAQTGEFMANSRLASNEQPALEEGNRTGHLPGGDRGTPVQLGPLLTAYLVDQATGEGDFARLFRSPLPSAALAFR